MAEASADDNAVSSSKANEEIGTEVVRPNSLDLDLEIASEELEKSLESEEPRPGTR